MHQRYITQFPLAPPKILVSIFVTIKIDIIKKKKGKDNEEASYQKFQPHLWLSYLQFLASYF